MRRVGRTAGLRISSVMVLAVVASVCVLVGPVSAIEVLTDNQMQAVRGACSPQECTGLGPGSNCIIQCKKMNDDPPVYLMWLGHDYNTCASSVNGECPSVMVECGLQYMSSTPGCVDPKPRVVQASGCTP